MARRPSQALALLMLATTLLFAVWYIAYLIRHASPATPVAVGVLAFTTLVELVASFYCFGYAYSSIAYLWMRDQPAASPPNPDGPLPSVGVVYLCCNDLDPEALRSLARLKYAGELLLIVHDDSVSPEARAEVDDLVDELCEDGCRVLLLRRPDKGGGKPAVLNYVLEKSGHLHDYFLVCDNDSIAVDPEVVSKALPHFADERVAVVQGRNVAVESADYSPINRRLARSIDAFHLFLSTNARFGWTTFVGHNAVLRTRAVDEVGGFTPGFFSDDLDLTVRLNLGGYRVVYAPTVRMGEKHPPSYTAFRKRSYKWAYGCAQTLRKHALAVLTTPRLSVAEKVGFFQFTGFFALQALLLLFLVLKFILVPLVLGPQSFDVVGSAVVGAAYIATVFLPQLAYYLKERALARSAPSIALCGVVYGGTDFCSSRGVWDCLLGRKRAWIPTNQPTAQRGPSGVGLEVLFALALLGVPLLVQPELLFIPTTFLFAGKFLFGPALALLYDDERYRLAAVVAPRRREALAVAAALLLALTATLAIPAGTGARPRPQPGNSAVEVHGKQLFVGGQPFLVKGIHYGPWRPGTGPGKHYPYPSREEIDTDLRLINDLHANTILVFDPAGHVLDVAQERGLKVIVTVSINWWAFGKPEGESGRAAILKKVEELRDKPALLAWVLGNEISGVALSQSGEKVFHDGLESLYRAVKAVDARHPVSHSNWPPTRDLDLSFLDFASFNLYPYWPPEVAALGYGNYIREVLEPIAGDRPLLITEFGANTIEMPETIQARTVRRCWQDIRASAACGGVVFEFADEWWKNFNNPRRPGDWWDRVDAPDDEKTHDRDPEEHYGLFTGERKPKPAAAAVGEMFADEAEPVTTAPARTVNARMVAAVLVAMLVLAAAGAWLWARASRPAASESPRGA